MAFLAWKDSLSVSIAEVDEQHKKLIDIINELHAAMMQGKGKEVLGKVFDDLIAYTVYHFSTEEKYMDQYSYTSMSPHKLEHQKLTEQVIELQKRYREGKFHISIETLSFLRDWLTSHIKETDKKFGSYLLQMGMK